MEEEIRQEIHKEGYDKEEEYFFKKNLEWIQKKRKELDAKRRAREAEHSKAAHWMRCPKCGGQMAEISMGDVRVDECSGCKGIFFDKGELDLMYAEREAVGLFNRLKHLFE